MIARWFVGSSFVVALSSLLSGCWAEAVSQDRFGGTVKIPDTSEAAMEQARSIMLNHCGDRNFRIDGWDEVATETRTDAPDMTEVYVYYSCLRPVSPMR